MENISENLRYWKEDGGELIWMRDPLKLPSLCLTFEQGSPWYIFISLQMICKVFKGDLGERCVKKKQELDHLITKQPVSQLSTPVFDPNNRFPWTTISVAAHHPPAPGQEKFFAASVNCPDKENCPLNLQQRLC
jgi:hypothetical protein